MHEFTIEDFTRYVIRLLQPLGNITLENPDELKEFPLAVVNNSMQSINKTDNNIPIYIRFSINIEWWTDSKYDSMKKYELTNKLLRAYNFIQKGTQTDIYDDATQKYRYGGRYEVNYNGLTNSFERIM